MGAACEMCATGLTCSQGSCVNTATLTRIGDTCTQDSDCAALGGTFKCKKTTTRGDGTYEGGYCTKLCTGATAATDCGNPLIDGGFVQGQALCVGLNPAYGEADTFCWDACGGANGNCRTPGYACYTLGTGSGCWLSPIPTVDAGLPADKLGNDCTMSAQCANPPEARYAQCIPEFAPLADGGVSTNPTSYVGGYCTADCGVSAGLCGTDGICLGDWPVQNFDGCAKKCNAPMQGQSTCKNGYVCFPYSLGLADGGSVAADAGFCDPSCFNPGRACNSDAGFFCDAGYCVR